VKSITSSASLGDGDLGQGEVVVVDSSGHQVVEVDFPNLEVEAEIVGERRRQRPLEPSHECVAFLFPEARSRKVGDHRENARSGRLEGIHRTRSRIAAAGADGQGQRQEGGDDARRRGGHERNHTRRSRGPALSDRNEPGIVFASETCQVWGVGRREREGPWVRARSANGSNVLSGGSDSGWNTDRGT
jgi:hypothetical protein